MNNPFARFAEQAEVNLADISRRAIDSVTLPIKLKSQEVIGEVTATVTATLKTILIKTGLAVVAGIMALVALGFAVAALHGELTLLVGPIAATLILAGIFAFLAAAALLAMMFWPKPAAAGDKVAATAKADAERIAAATRHQVRKAERTVEAVSRSEPAPDDETADMKSGLGAIAAALGEAGFKREQAGLRAGLALAEQLRPMQLVSLALIGGFIAGLRISKRR